MYVESLVLVVFLFYFYYMTNHDASVHVNKPSIAYVSPTNVFLQQIVQHGDKFRYIVNGTVAWEESMPNSFRIENGKVTTSDVCFGQPDGSKRLATGKMLYESIRNYKLIQDKPQFESNAITTAQDKRVFYFTCKDSRIDTLHMCPPGHTFKNHSCQPIDLCHGQKDGTRFADAFNIESYFECEQEAAVHKSCPPNHVFLHDHCASSTESALYCQYHKEPKILDAQTLMVCRNNKVAYETCPPGFRYFDKPYCESSLCDGPQAVVSMPNVENGPFSYSPGFLRCEKNKIKSVEYCPIHWDPSIAVAENLTHLPQVFDGKKCALPSFCENVTSSDPNLIVPAYEFTKHVQNWKHSSLMDSLTGYKCEGGVKKRVNMDPGFQINKRFKSEKICNVEKIPVSGRPDAYYDCVRGQLELCPKGHYFDAEKCAPHIPNAFSFNGIDIFAFDSLRPDNWMSPWDYSKIPHAEPCTEPESVWMQLYNLCSHPDCTKYPFLSQISYQLKLKDGSQCVFRENDRRLVKTDPSDTQYLYWSQRQKNHESDTCIPGQRIQSGHFVWDSTIYMTCDDNQPFVFCPSSNTMGVMKDTMYACIPTSMHGIIPPNSKVEFTAHEVNLIRPLDSDAIVLIDGKDIIIKKEGFAPQKDFVLETLMQGVEILYKHRVTYPPNAYVIENGLLKWYNSSQGGYLMKADGFTKKPLEFPKYHIKQSIDHLTT